MPQLVKVPDVGTLQFPDHFTDEEVASAIAANFPDVAKSIPPERRASLDRVWQGMETERKRREAKDAELRQQRAELQGPVDYPPLVDVAQAAGSVVGGAGRVIGAIPEAIGIGAQALQKAVTGDAPPLEEFGTFKLGKSLREASERVSDVVPREERSFVTGTVPEALGGAGAFIAGGLFGKLAKLPAVAVTALLGSAAGGTEGYEDAILSGADAKTAWESFLLNAGVGTSEIIPIAGILNRINRKTGGSLGKLIKQTLTETAEEAGQEVAQTALSNAIAKELYDEERQYLAGVGESGAAGGVTGFVMSLAASAVGGRRIPGVTTTLEKTAPLTAQAVVDTAPKVQADITPLAGPEMEVLPEKPPPLTVPKEVIPVEETKVEEEKGTVLSPATPEAAPATTETTTDQTIGIVPPGAELTQKVIEAFKPREVGDAPELVIDETHRVPRLQEYEAEKTIASTPQGMSRIPGAGKLVDPRTGADNPTDQAIITRAYSAEKGKNVAALWAQTQQKFKGLFPVNKETGQVTMEAGATGYLSDVIEAELREPGSQPLTQQQRAWVENEYKPILADVTSMLKEEGVKEFATDEDESVDPEELNAYFPRPVIGKRIEGVKQKVVSALTGTRPGSKGFFQKGRIFKSEAEGAASQDQIIYDPDPISRVSKLIAGAYRSVADTRLANDKSLGGETVKERYDRMVLESGPTLELLDGDEKIEALRDIRSKAEHAVLLKETTAPVGPAFIGKIFPSDVAEKLRKHYGEGSEAWIRTIERVSSISKGLTLVGDLSAPFVQGLGIMFRNPTRWAKAAAKGYQALFDSNTMGKLLEKPEYKKAASEFVQSGGNILRLQDFMAGLEKGQPLEKVPVLGKLFFAPTGRAFGAFLDAAKLELWRAYSQGAKSSDFPAIAETVENMLFMGRMEQIGLRPGRSSMERLLLLAPMYMRGAGNLVANALSRGVSGKMSRQMLASFAAGTTMVSIAGMIAAGLDEEEIEERLDPSTGKFLKVPVRIGDKVIEVGFGNVLLSVVRLLGNTVDFYNSDKPVDTAGMDSPFIRFLRSKSAAIPSLLFDMATGKDFMGNEITLSESVAKKLTPLWTQQLVEGGRTTESAADALFTFFGLQSFPESKTSEFVRVRDEQSQKQYGKGYAELDMNRQAKITKELLGKPEFKKEPATANIIEKAFENKVERQKAIQSGLSASNQKKVETYAIRVPGYNATIRHNGIDVPLTKAQQEDYEKLIIEEFNKALDEVNEEWLKRAKPDLLSKSIQKRFTNARERAKNRFVQSQGK